MKHAQIRIGRAFVLAVAAGALARTAHAADVVDLRRESVWQVDDVTTTTVKEATEQAIAEVSADPAQPAPAPSIHKIVVDARLLERCTEVDAKGRRLRTAVYVAAFSAEDGPTKDTSLEGAVLEVTGTGKDRAARVVSSKEELSKTAKAFLSRRYGGGRPDPDSARSYWLPKSPVGVGDMWSADIGAFLEATESGTALDRTKTATSCTLASVEKGIATVTCSGRLALASFPAKAKGKPVPWKSGGIQNVQGTIAMTVEGRLVPSSLSFATNLVGEAELGGKTVSFRFKTDRTIEEAVGGAWPATVKLPEPPAAPATAPGTPASPAPVGEPGMAGMGG